MPTHAWRGPIVLGLALVLLVTACDLLMPEAPLPPDSVRVVVLGLPADLPARVTIKDPDGRETVLDGSETLTGLAPGTYQVTPAIVDFRGNELHAVPEKLSVALVAGGSATAVVRYAPDRYLGRAAMDRLNAYRVGAGLPAVALDEEGSLPQWLHTRYAAENRTWGHTEDPSLPWSTPEGLEAARRSNLAYGSVFVDRRDPRDGAMWIDVWAQAPFHFVSMLDPRTTRVRFASYRAQHPCSEGAPEGCTQVRAVAALQPLREGAWPAQAVVEFPGPGSTIDVAVFRGEWPSPIAHCPGYEPPAGLPLIALVAPNVTSPPRILSSTIERDGHAVDHCAVDAIRYHNPDAEQQHLARSILAAHGAVVLVPRQPLAPGETYRVVLETDRHRHDWTFRTAEVVIQHLGTRVGAGPMGTGATFQRHAEGP